MQTDTSCQLSVICKLTEGALSPLVEVINKDIEWERPQYKNLEIRRKFHVLLRTIHELQQTVENDENLS